MKKEKPENTIRSSVKIKKKKKINVPFFSSIWFHFPCVALHHRGRRGGVGCSENESGKGQKKEITHILKNCEHLTSQNTPDTMTEPI